MPDVRQLVRRPGQPWTVRVALLERPPSLAGLRPVVRAHDRDLRRSAWAWAASGRLPRPAAWPARTPRRPRGLQAMSSGAATSGAPAGETLTVVITSPTAKASDPTFKARRRDDRPAPRRDQRHRRRHDRTGPDRRDRPVRGAAGGRPPRARRGRGDRQRPDPGRVDRARDTRPGGRRPRSAAAQADFPAFAIHAVSNTLTNDQIGTVVNADLDGSLRISLPATFVILVLAFGAVVAAFVPLFLAITALLAAFGLLGIYSQVVQPGQPVRDAAGRPDRPGRGRRLLAVHGHPLPRRAAGRPRPSWPRSRRPAPRPAGRSSSRAWP